ncbi:hypothetical protein NOR51B_1719 [Luminiphilus syltensis NOR5-1B]|uniref:Uncharacterized protein n=1 Tax=Luminiphilus syltensis NOR5-1B TaxID=565045 RepID=B8KXT9_9GAMM|nr:hypothetical protein NOR51B_1719 [Luminiphilus syltensis NOR5-1B]
MRRREIGKRKQFDSSCSGIQDFVPALLINHHSLPCCYADGSERQSMYDNFEA